MLTDVASFLLVWRMPFDLICYSIVFAGTFYIAIHNRRLPPWHVTPLWYLGLGSFFTAFSILCQYIFGPEFPMSYRNVGLIGEAVTHITLALIAAIMFTGTVRHDIEGKKKRSQNVS